MKQAIPKGCCKDCRWAETLPEDIPPEVRGTMVYRCLALPKVYELTQAGARLVGGQDKRLDRMAWVTKSSPKLPTDFCSFFEPVPPS